MPHNYQTRQSYVVTMACYNLCSGQEYLRVHETVGLFGWAYTIVYDHGL